MDSTTPLSGKSPRKFPFDTYDLVVMALLAAISAVAYAGLAQVWTALTAATGPLGGAFLGLFQFGHLIAFALLRKRGVALITSILTTVGQLLIGDPSGAYVLGWGVFHGLGAEAVFFAMGYKSASFPTLAVSGGLAAVLGQLYSYWVFGWQGVLWLFYVSLPILFVSSAFESGGLAYYVTKALAKTRLVRQR
jgi:energy-coupling factor transport system substrate-specific component